MFLLYRWQHHTVRNAFAYNLGMRGASHDVILHSTVITEIFPQTEKRMASDMKPLCATRCLTFENFTSYGQKIPDTACEYDNNLINYMFCDIT